ncbi:metal ABC transporter permease, partial [Catenulispora rubra]|uniref:metal ABC transporter permease n=1 Tax=Catenulispora rubra TaxID=280293 RepID=UPI001E2D7C7E
MLSDTIFSLPFMQRAFLAAFAIGLAAPAIGTYLVQRRLALMGDGLGHVAISLRMSSSPTTRPAQLWSIRIRFSSSMPSSVKKAMAASRSS